MSKIALVTGADKGIGKQITRQLAEKGCQVYLGCRDLQKGKRAIKDLNQFSGSIRLLLVDLLQPETFRKAPGAIRKADSRLDILINNAGIAVDWDYEADDVPIKKLRQTFEVNFFGMVEFTQMMLPLLRASDAGRIVNQSSRLGSLGLHSTRGSDMDDLKAFAYGSSKTAINAFTVHLAHALRDSSIKVNSAHPGVVSTGLNASVTRGPNSVEMLDASQGAQTAVQLASLPPDGPSGGFFHFGESLPW